MKRAVELDLSEQQAERLAVQLVERLNDPAKLRLAEQLDRQTRRARWEPLVRKMRARFAKNPLSAREIRQVCEQVRQERFERAQRAGRR